MKKPYTMKEEESAIVSEPSATTYPQSSESHLEFTNRDDVTRSITGEELLNRLRPRIKALFK